MKDTEFAFAVAKIRSNENKLLSHAVMDSLVGADSYDDCIRILSEAGYGDFSSKDSDVILAEKQKEAFNLIYDSCPDKSCIDFLIVKNDFHNFKAILKCLVAHDDRMDELLLSPTVCDKELAKKAVMQKQFDLLPKLFSETCAKAYDVLTRTLDGQLCEIILDKACIESMITLAKDSGDEFSISLAEKMAAVSNIKIALRCIRTGKDAEFMKQAFANCSLIDADKLTEASLSGEQALMEYASFVGFAAVASKIPLGYAAFEKECDDILIDCVKDAKFKALGIAPVVAYYFASESEIKTVRIILSCKKNGFGADIIRERVRKLYV